MVLSFGFRMAQDSRILDVVACRAAANRCLSQTSLYGYHIYVYTYLCRHVEMVSHTRKDRGKGHSFDRLPYELQATANITQMIYGHELLIGEYIWDYTKMQQGPLCPLSTVQGPSS